MALKIVSMENSKGDVYNGYGKGGVNLHRQKGFRDKHGVCMYTDRIQVQ